MPARLRPCVCVSESDTVQDVIAKVRAQTVCFWGESTVNVFRARQDSVWLKENHADVCGARGSYCIRGNRLEMDGARAILALLGPGSEAQGIVHLVIQLQSSSGAGVVPDVLRKTFKKFTRSRIDNNFALMDLENIEEAGIEEINVMSLHSLNNKVPDVAAFPSRLFWRRAEHHVFTILTEKIFKTKSNLSKLSLALVGSPGIGKSTLAQMLAWHVSRLLHLDVIHLHQVRPGLVVLKFFTANGDLVCGEVVEDAVPRLDDALARAEGRFLEPFVIVDGFKDQPKCFHMCVTSGSFNGKTLAQCTVLLPSWSQRNVDAMAKAMGEEDDVAKRYQLYGGDLRSIFAQDQAGAKTMMASAMARITELNAYLQMSDQGRSSPDQVDRIRRYVVRNPTNASDYQDSSCWIPLVESAIFRRALIQRQSLRWIKRLVKTSVGTPLYGHAYEMGLHCTAVKTDSKILVLTQVTVHDIGARRTSDRIAEQQQQQISGSRAAEGDTDVSMDGDQNIRQPTSASGESNRQDHATDAGVDVSMDGADELREPASDSGNSETGLLIELETIRLDTSKPVIEGRTNDAALSAMLKFPTFKAIDAVARCELVPRRGTRVSVIALLQYTVAGRKDMLSDKTLTDYKTRLQGAMEIDNQLPIVLVFVSPPNQNLSVNTPYVMTMYKAHFDVESPTGDLTGDENLELDHVTTDDPPTTGPVAPTEEIRRTAAEAHAQSQSA